MRLRNFTFVLLAALIGASGLEAQAGETPSECRRFASESARPQDFAPRLARLCVRLVEAHDSAPGMSDEEFAAATLLGQYLAVVGELDLRKGAAGFGVTLPGRVRATNEVARYLIARHIGLLAAADRLAPAPPLTAGLPQTPLR